MTGEQDDDVRSETDVVSDAGVVSDAVEGSDVDAPGVSLAKASSKPVPRTKNARANSDRTMKSTAAPEPATKESATKKTAAKVPATEEPATSEPAGKKPAGKQISITLSARAIWRSLVALVVVAAIAGVAVLGWLYYQDQQRLKAFGEAKDASAIFAQKLTSSMNADTVANMKDIVGPLTTGDYRKHLESQLGDTTKAIQSINVKNTKINVQKVSVMDFDTDHASTMAVVQVTGTSTLAPQGGTSLFMYSLKLDKVDGAWLVSDLDAMQAGLSDSGGAGAGGAPAAPAAPAPAPAPAG
ncbi:hypothetical protein ACLQ3C_14380 [Gordonia sp. DT30]|uniref:hypothetical protein n=1 Tax=unclassified Gordonia (in: high G+C Gram-positive bacteria) TaxID=2657482 RepID=UPI003CE92C19